MTAIIHGTASISPAFRSQCERIVRDLHLTNDLPIDSIEPLTGGVSSDIAVVSAADIRFCIKCELDQLRVDAPWFAPVRRNLAEYRWIEFAATVASDAVPTLLGRSDRENGFAMTYIDPEQAWNFKAGLLSGDTVGTDKISGREDSVSVHCARIGEILGRIHAASTSNDFDSEAFANASDFYALRLEPYLIHSASIHPAVSARLTDLAAQCDQARVALIHGDVSPKNLLIGSNGPILLDAECATFGDPAFDIAFFANHLVLKAFHLPDNAPSFLSAAEQFLVRYLAQVNWETPTGIDARCAALLPGLMLARVDGKSPAEYLAPHTRAAVRETALASLTDTPATTTELFERVGTAIRSKPN